MVRSFARLRVSARLATGSAAAQEPIPSQCIAVAEAIDGAAFPRRANYADPGLADTLRLSCTDPRVS